MPKVVDHETRREELVRTVWRIMARRGPAAVTMRQISAEAGYANGALKTYFAGKADLLEATYTHVFERTNERVERAAAGLSGLGALVAFCREVMPLDEERLDEERLDEARVVMAFWQEAAHDPARAAHNNRYMHQWRDSVAGWVAEARAAGDVTGHVDLASWVDALLTFLLGTQITAALDPTNVTPAHLERQLAAQLALVRVPAEAPVGAKAAADVAAPGNAGATASATTLGGAATPGGSAATGDGPVT